ncbi:MAG: DNA/RNA non-specific endonuclease [Acidobacteriota bacterium]|nr:MAG: DNA/RNA non-specific endonuclease [Acidobacteriota bacterium]
MKSIVLFVAVAVLAAVGLFFEAHTSAQSDRLGLADSTLVSPHLVISQFQAGSPGNANDEFIEILNTSAAPIDLNGYRLVYRSQNGTNDVNFHAWTTSTVLQAGQYYLIASTSYTGGVTPNVTYNNATCSCALAAANGGLAIRQGEANSGAVIDAVGWGTGSNIFFEGTRTTAPGDGNSKARLQNGCQDTDDNSVDFQTLTPSAARNTSTAPVTCSGSGTNLFASLTASPTTVTPPGNTLLTATVIPATTPPSTGITVTVNLTNIDGPASQPLFDDGTNGDVTAGDNIFSFLATVPTTVSGGTKQITGLAADGQGRTVNLNLNLNVNAPLPNENPLLFGNPSNATSDPANQNNYLIERPAYTLSYNRSKGTPNWVAWRLDTSWIGSANSGSFSPDTSLPAGWYQVQPSDYSGSGYDRGHMCPSGDRTVNQTINDSTYLMTNIIPQLPANNQGPWVDFENYCRTLASQGNEIYIISGPHGNAGTIAGGQVVIPQVTWKVVLILPNGNNDLQRITKATRAFGIIVPNQPPLTQSTPWRTFRTTVDAVEYLTGYDFFSAIGKNTQEILERKRDKQ